MRKILIVEDDRELKEGICYALQKAGYLTESADSVQNAKTLFLKEGADVILLDVNLPDGEGFDFCKWVKERTLVPVLFLTARDLEEDALCGYEAGAEDYVTKPFSMKILLDFDATRAWVGGKECVLTPTEFRMLRYFTENAGVLLTYSVLLEKLWDSTGAYVDKHTLAVNVNRLRKKIEDEEHRYILSVYGMGYQWAEA